MRYIDLHSDTLAKAFIEGKNTITNMPNCMVDVERLYKVGAGAQFFAMFLPQPGDEEHFGVKYPSDDEYISSLASILRNTIQENPQKIAFAKNVDEMMKNQEEGKVSAFLTIEDGRSVDGKMEKIDQYYDLGVRLISLTWNYNNCFGAANSKDEEQMKTGLTCFGKEAISHMKELGMLVDVSHLSDGGFYDVADVLNSPFVASHSNCRELCNHPRNMTNEMIRMLSNKGGVAGLNFYAHFLKPVVDSADSRVVDMIAHVNHMYQFGGEDVIAIGTDFDGISGDNFDIDCPTKMYLLFDALKKAGYSERQIDKFAFGNASRVMKDVLK